MDDKYYDTSTRELAAGVLRQAVSDQEVEFETLELWCGLVDLDPALVPTRKGPGLWAEVVLSFRGHFVMSPPNKKKATGY
ncbi:hypothetical protein LCGC14_2917790 [marine sediment metagenome]|uniref:Uncharacterized protein n=1 Tax=marine sediment metagenome TaxID=412755 RepID=A0A0F8XPY3_9ZZZZ